MKQGTKEWIEHRKKCITSTDAPIIMGCGFKSPYRLWQEKLDLVPIPPENEAMRKGRELEEFALDAYCEKVGELFYKPESHFYEKDKRFMTSLDGISFDGKKAVEIKCGEKVFEPVGVPRYVWVQCQHHIMVENLPRIDCYRWWDSEEKLDTIARDDRFIEEMFKKELAFLECIEKKTPPEENNEIVKIEDASFFSLEELYDYWSRKADEAEQRKEDYRKELIKLTGNNSARGKIFQMQKIMKKGNIDYSLVPELRNIDLDKYRKPDAEQWRITRLNES